MKLKCTNKDCKHKGVLQESSNFYTQYGAWRGYQSHCKDCFKEKYKSKDKRNTDNWMKILIG